MKNKKNGFTLIELIVVITIIAVLTVAGIVSYSGTNKKARDSRRMADLEKIRIALELYRQGTGSTYPLLLDSLVDKEYLQSIPTDPKNIGTTYLYTPSINGYKYIIKASVEDLGVTNIAGGYYQVSNP